MNEVDKAAIQAFEDEVIDRLYVLNSERAREEKRLGLGKKTKTKAKPKKKKTGGNQSSLFGEDK